MSRPTLLGIKSYPLVSSLALILPVCMFVPECTRKRARRAITLGDLRGTAHYAQRSAGRCPLRSDICGEVCFTTIVLLGQAPVEIRSLAVVKELGRNSIAVKCSFGGGKLRCLGTVYNNTRFRANSGHDWIVPASRGAFSTFPNGATLA